MAGGLQNDAGRALNRVPTPFFAPLPTPCCPSCMAEKSSLCMSDVLPAAGGWTPTARNNSPCMGTPRGSPIGHCHVITCVLTSKPRAGLGIYIATRCNQDPALRIPKLEWHARSHRQLQPFPSAGTRRSRLSDSRPVHASSSAAKHADRLLVGHLVPNPDLLGFLRRFSV